MMCASLLNFLEKIKMKSSKSIKKFVTLREAESLAKKK